MLLTSVCISKTSSADGSRGPLAAVKPEAPRWDVGTATWTEATGRDREAEPKSSRPPIKAGPPSQEGVETQTMTKPQPPALNPTRRPSLQPPRYPGNASSHRPSMPPPLPRPVSHRRPSGPPQRASMGCFQKPLIL